ncbi:uncharacterized protein LAESUDRAFT_665924, partial [Laetiporus sulphureus 93-53]
MPLWESCGFNVVPAPGGNYEIYNSYLVKKQYVPGARLRDPEFNLPVWFRRRVEFESGHFHGPRGGEEMSYALALGVEATLNDEFPFPEGAEPQDPGVPRFHCVQASDEVVIEDHYLDIIAAVPNAALRNVDYDVCNAFARAVRRRFVIRDPDREDLGEVLAELFDRTIEEVHFGAIELGTVGISPRNDPLPAVQRNAAVPCDFQHVIPEPPTIVIDVDGHPARALLDTGSMADFISARLVHQLGLKSFELAKPLPVHLAVQGSRSKIHSGCQAQVAYQSIKEVRRFDVANLSTYDVVLGTPFFFQHQVALGFNPTTVEIGSTKSLPIEGKRLKVLESRATEIYEDRLESVREYLREYAKPICKSTQDSPLPPLRAINHVIPLKDPAKVYTWRPARCPEPMCAAWTEKRAAYLRS